MSTHPMSEEKLATFPGKTAVASRGALYSLPETEIGPETTVAAAIVKHLESLGVEQAFGVSGGAIALFFDALAESEAIEIQHCRHESGAAFAATEAYFATGVPSLVFATTGPGTLNALNGLMAARWDGAKVVLVSGATSAAQRGRWATQETSSYTVPEGPLYQSGAIFDYAIRLESAAEFPEVARRLSLGLLRPGRFVAHVSLPMGVQGRRVDLPRRLPQTRVSAPAAKSDEVRRCVEILSEGPFALWLGHGARGAASQVRQLVERTGARVFCSPRGKGIFPEDDSRFLGVTGIGGHETVIDYMVQEKPPWVLVLGSRLGEATSFWDVDMVPQEGFLHVDIDPEVPGTAYPEARTVAIQAEVGGFLEELLREIPGELGAARHELVSRRTMPPIMMPLRGRRPVRPQVLMQAIQRVFVTGSDALVLAECGNAFAWTNHFLRFDQPGRYRVSTLYGSMGHAAAGVVGAAMAHRGKAVAVLGDGAMLMNSEVSTAVQYRASAVWIVLNDSGYGMCRDGHRALGLTDSHVDIPQVDFVGLARSMGADGARARTEDQVESALRRALAAPGPFVVDVLIDGDEVSPLVKRFESLIRQGNSKNVAGWEI